MARIPGWPREFVLNKSYDAKCDICRNQTSTIGVHRDCEFKHNTCGTCCDKHSWDEKKQIFECPRCVYERMVEVKKMMTKWMEEKSFVNAPEIGPGAFRYSAEVAKKKAQNKGRQNPDELMKMSSPSTPKPSIDAIDDDATVRIPKKGLKAIGAGSSSSSSTRTTRREIKHNGTVKECVRAKQVDDCECCKAALCMDCVWEVVSK